MNEVVGECGICCFGALPQRGFSNIFIAQPRRKQTTTGIYMRGLRNHRQFFVALLCIWRSLVWKETRAVQNETKRSASLLPSLLPSNPPIQFLVGLIDNGKIFSSEGWAKGSKYGHFSQCLKRQLWQAHGKSRARYGLTMKPLQCDHCRIVLRVETFWKHVRLIAFWVCQLCARIKLMHSDPRRWLFLHADLDSNFKIAPFHAPRFTGPDDVSWSIESLKRVSKRTHKNILAGVVLPSKC